MALVQHAVDVVLPLGMGFDASPERKSHAQVRKEGIENSQTHEVHVAAAEAMTVQELQGLQTPPGTRLIIVPKKGHGCKMAIYANHRTAPLLVTVDLLDTLLQRLTHRARVFLWSYAREHGMEESEVVSSIHLIRDPSAKREKLGGELNRLTYMDLVRVVEGGVDQDDSDAEGDYDDDEDDVEEEDFSTTASALKHEYLAAKLVVAGLTPGLRWLDSLLQLAECSMLLADADSLDDSVPFSAAGLRQQMRRFMKSKTRQDRNQEAHLFGCLLSRDFAVEATGATEVEEDVGAFDKDGKRVKAAPRFVLPQRPFNSLPVEQPLFGPKAFSCNNSALADREIILGDLVEDNERSIEALTEDMSGARELLTMAIRFWKKQVEALKEKRKLKQAKNKSARKKPKLG